MRLDQIRQWHRYLICAIHKVLTSKGYLKFDFMFIVVRFGMYHPEG